MNSLVIAITTSSGAVFSRTVSDEIAAKIEGQLRDGALIELPAASTVDKGYTQTDLRSDRRDLIAAAHVESLAVTTTTTVPKAGRR